jgi:hypothetical protein
VEATCVRHRDSIPSQRDRRQQRAREFARDCGHHSAWDLSIDGKALRKFCPQKPFSFEEAAIPISDSPEACSRLEDSRPGGTFDTSSRKRRDHPYHALHFAHGRDCRRLAVERRLMDGNSGSAAKRKRGRRVQKRLVLPQHRYPRLILL